MALSDCVRCWNTPCTCGWGWRLYTRKARIETILMLVKTLFQKNISYEEYIKCHMKTNRNGAR